VDDPVLNARLPVQPRRVPLSHPLAGAAWILLAVASFPSLRAAGGQPEVRAGSELDFRPYCYIDRDGRPTGFGVELLEAVADKMGISLSFTVGEWDAVWEGLRTGRFDVLPVVARTPGREPLVDFSVPHTETFDAFFRRTGQPALANLAAAAGMEIVVLRSDAAQHELEERRFPGKVIPVDSIPAGLRLVADGRHDAFLCSKLVGVLERMEAGIKGIEPGPPIPDYTRVFSFAVRKGDAELLEKLNRGLIRIKADGTYDRIFRRWLEVEEPWRWWLPILKWTVLGLVLLAGLAVVQQRLVRRRTRQLAAEVAERRKAEEALKELNATLEARVAERTAEVQASEARFRALYSAMDEGMALHEVVCDGTGRAVDYRLLDVNPAFERITGISRERAVGAPASALYGGGVPPYLDIYARVAASGRHESFETRFEPLGKDFRISAFSPGEGRFATVFEDITERKLAQARLATSELKYRRLHDSMRDAIVIVDMTGRIMGCNGAFLNMVGYDEAEVLELTYRDLTPEKWHAIEDRIVREQILARDFSDVYETEYRRKDGTVIPVELRTFLIRDDSGRPSQMWAIVRDIAERKRAEHTLKAAKVTAEQARAAAESASRAKDQFIAVLSHELRTPLTPAVAALSLLRSDDRLPHDVREDLDMIGRNVDLEVRLIADLLDVSRIISGKMHFEKETVDVARAIREAAAIVAGDLDAKGQLLTIETPGAPYLMCGDAARLQQVFWNLLRNAIKFTPERGSIAIRARQLPVDRCPLVADPCPIGMGKCPLGAGVDGVEPCGAWNLVVEVIDSGCGIDPGVLPRLFTAFEQGREARSFGGLGLGLAICKAVVEMHGGSIGARSDGPGRGAAFTVRLLVAQCPLEAKAATPFEPRSRAGPAPAASPRFRIVLVEDHADTASLLQRLLKARGYDVVLADSVAAGLAEIERCDPDVLISDIGLPDGTGFDLLRRLSERGKRVPAIALSGYGTPADIEKSKAAGFVEHLVKPINGIDAVLAAVKRVARRDG
jgi:PAS domain S-box-containing protein